MKFIISLFLLVNSILNANVLYDAIKDVDINTIALLLETKDKEDKPVYQPDKHCYSLLENIKDNVKKDQIKALLDNACKKYGIDVDNIVDLVYPKDINNRDDILELFRPSESIEPIQIGTRSFALCFHDKKWILKQLTKTSCGYACLMMRLLDHEKPVDQFANLLLSFIGTYVDDLVEKFISVGIKAEKKEFSGNKIIGENNLNSIIYLSENIPFKGPALVNGHNSQGGGHWFIIDDIQLPCFENDENTGWAIIRDPCHGWRIKITWAGFVPLIIKKANSKNWMEKHTKGMGEIIWTSLENLE